MALLMERTTIHLVLLLTWLVPLVMSTPQILFPINSQFPPVARAFQFFSFTFSELTFASDNSPLQYRLEGAPPWLQFDGGTRKFYGAPSIGDVGEISLQLYVTDSTGHLKHDVKLVVSAFAAATVGKHIGEQLLGIGRTDAQGGLVLSQGQKFNFSFTRDTFYGRDKIKRYSAVSSNNTPLPSWIHFHQESLHFSGEAPPLGSQDTPPHRFGLKLIAEDFPNFEGSSDAFEVVVNHHLAVARLEIKVNVTIGMVLFYRLSLEEIILDDRPIKKDHIRDISANASEWLQFDREGLVITGSAVSAPRTEVMSIIVKDIYNNEAKLNVSVRAIWEYVFSMNLDNVDATRGKKFEYSLNSIIANPSNLNITVRLRPSVGWIFFNHETLTFTGDIPLDAEDVQIEVYAENTLSGHSDSRTFDIVMKGPKLGDDIPTSDINVNNARQPQSRSKVKLIVLATLLPIVGAITILLCLACRRSVISRLKRQRPGQRSGTPTCDMISRPIHTSPTSEPWPVAMIPKKEVKYTPVVERGYTGPGFVGVAPTAKKHTKDNSVGSDLLMRVGTNGIGSAITTDDDNHTSGGIFGDMPRRLTSIPMLTKIVSGEPLKVPSAKNSNSSRNWAPLGTGSGEGIPGEAMTSSTQKSWRKTMLWAQRGGPRDSDATVDTVSTAEVFSVRLVGSPIIIGDTGEPRQWQPRGLRKGDSPKDRFHAPNEEQQKEKDKEKEKHVYFGDEWEITELPTPEQHYVPRPSPRDTQRSLQKYRDGRASFGTASFDDDFSFARTPASPRVPSLQGPSVWTTLVQGKVRELGAGLRSINEERQKSKAVDMNKAETTGKANGKTYGWPF